MTQHVLRNMIGGTNPYPFYTGYNFSNNDYACACIGIQVSGDQTLFHDYGFKHNGIAMTHHCTIYYR